jgi:hypothetical protein
MNLPRFTTKHVGGSTMHGSRRGPWHVVERETGVTMSSHRTHRQASITARVLNLPTCPEFRPDHNGECLNCDEWMDEHTTEAIAAGQRRVDKP